MNYHCPNYDRTIPPSARRVHQGRITWVWCPWCLNGEGAPQPHPFITTGSSLVAREAGGIEYHLIGMDVYRALPGCGLKQYCWAKNWATTKAFQRIHEHKESYTTEELRLMGGREHTRGPDAARRRQTEKRRRAGQ